MYCNQWIGKEQRMVSFLEMNRSIHWRKKGSSIPILLPSQPLSLFCISKFPSHLFDVCLAKVHWKSNLYLAGIISTRNRNINTTEITFSFPSLRKKHIAETKRYCSFIIKDLFCESRFSKPELTVSKCAPPNAWWIVWKWKLKSNFLWKIQWLLEVNAVKINRKANHPAISKIGLKQLMIIRKIKKSIPPFPDWNWRAQIEWNGIHLRQVTAGKKWSLAGRIDYSRKVICSIRVP